MTEPQAFEHALVAWRTNDGGAETLAALNDLGAQGWEAVGLAPRSWPAPMAGMGAHVVSEVIVLLKRPLARPQR